MTQDNKNTSESTAVKLNSHKKSNRILLKIFLIITISFICLMVYKNLQIKEEIIIPEDTIHHLIDTYCNNEDGVRNLKRCLEIVHTKLNLYRLMKPGTNLFEEDMSLKVEFPFTVTRDVVDKLIKRNTDNLTLMHSLYL